MTFTVLDAPTNLGRRPPARGVEPGVKGLADALRGCGIVERLGARDGGRVSPPAYVLDDIQACRALVPGYTRELAERIGELLDAGERPLVLGGDCSILLGAMLALRRRGRYGLLHVDGDVLDSALLPAVDSPAPDGLSFEELTALLQSVLDGAVGVQVTVFDPDLDEDGSQARALTDCLVSALAR